MPNCSLKSVSKLIFLAAIYKTSSCSMFSPVLAKVILWVGLKLYLILYGCIYCFLSPPHPPWLIWFSSLSCSFASSAVNYIFMAFIHFSVVCPSSWLADFLDEILDTKLFFHYKAMKTSSPSLWFSFNIGYSNFCCIEILHFSEIKFTNNSL